LSDTRFDCGPSFIVDNRSEFWDGLSNSVTNSHVVYPIDENTNELLKNGLLYEEAVSSDARLSVVSEFGHHRALYSLSPSRHRRTR